MYFNEEEDSGEEECELGYKGDDDDGDDNEEYEDKEEGWYNISNRKFAPDPVLPLDISPLIWDTPPNTAESGSDPLRLERLKFRGGGGTINCGSDLQLSRLPSDRGQPPALYPSVQLQGQPRRVPNDGDCICG